MKKLLNKIDWVLFAILLFAAFTPLLYKGYRLFLVSKLDNETLGLAINWGYVYMIFESVNIFVVVPSYWFIKRNAETQEESNRNMIIIVLFTNLAFFVSVLLVATIGFPIAKSSTVENEIAFSYVYGYILTYGITLSLHLFINIFVVYIIVHNKKGQAFLLTLLIAMLVMVSDTFFLSPGINPDAGLMSISESMLTSSLISLVIVVIIVYFIDARAWNNSFKLVTTSNLLEGWRVYSKNGMWLGLEAFIWNLLNALGVFCIFLFCEDEVETAFWIMDGLFWGFLLLPATAVTMFTAEGISNEENPQGKNDVVKISMLLTALSLMSWILLVPLLVLEVIPLVMASETETLISTAQTMCWVFVLFIAVQAPTKVLYTYFSTTDRSHFLTLGTLLGASLTWGLSFITLLILWQLGIVNDIPTEVAIYLIPIIYGLGIAFIFVFYCVFYFLRLKEDKESYELMKNWELNNQLVKTINSTSEL